MRELQVVWKSGPFELTQLEDIAESLWAQLSAHMRHDENDNPLGVVALQGVMGAGKTTLVRAVGQAAGIDGQAVSPTFGLVQCYQRRDWRLFHLDL